LRTARRLRTWGAIGGLVLPPLVTAAVGVAGDQSVAWLVWPFVGYLVGALYAEVALVRPRGSTRVATLARRDLMDYLPRRVRYLQWGLGAFALGLGGGALTLGYTRSYWAKPT